MNSAQRRKAKREHPHAITIRAESTQEYYKYDKKVHQAVQWCKKNCKGTWKVQNTWDCAEFKFSDHKDATIFALKWV